MTQRTDYGDLVRAKSKPGGYLFFDVVEFNVGQWCPDPQGKLPPTQVHLTININESPYPYTIRFKSPATLKLLIDQMTRDGEAVWPGSFSQHDSLGEQKKGGDK